VSSCAIGHPDDLVEAVAVGHWHWCMSPIFQPPEIEISGRDFRSEAGDVIGRYARWLHPLPTSLWL
jgi:hypothetical protein